MKKSELSFIDGFFSDRAKNNNPQKIFDWDKAAEIICERLKDTPDLKAEAGLQGDWDYTVGVIFEDGEPTTEDYTFLSSNWATPTLILSYDGCEQEEIECFVVGETRFNSGSKWDEKSLEILKQKGGEHAYLRFKT